MIHSQSKGSLLLKGLDHEITDKIALIAEIAGIIAVRIAVTIINDPTPRLNRVVKSALD
jgi:hypothetical protein